MENRSTYVQFVIFNPLKTPWNWIAFSQNSFVILPGLSYHLIRRDSGRLANEAFTSSTIVSSKQLNGLKITNCQLKIVQHSFHRLFVGFRKFFLCVYNTWLEAMVAFHYFPNIYCSLRSSCRRYPVSTFARILKLWWEKFFRGI